ncbi:MAG: CidA/LrgA family protein [Marinifilaceae bacterium]
MLIGILIILFFLLLGELCAWLINGFIPASVCGMLLLFIALKMGWIKSRSLKKVVDFLMNYMSLFFIPAGVGLLVAMEVLKSHWIAISVIVTISTFVTLFIVGKVMHYFESKNVNDGDVEL